MYHFPTKPSTVDSLVDPLPSCSYDESSIKVSGTTTKWDRITRNIREFVKHEVRREVRELVKQEQQFPLCKQPTLENIQQFSWHKVFEQMTDQAPVLHSALIGAATKSQKDEDLHRYFIALTI